jgi:hypothetical protein
MIYQQVEINISRNYYDEMFKSFIEKSGGTILVDK